VLLLFALFGIGAAMLAAGMIVLPYRRRFQRRLDRNAFMVSTLFSSGIGALIVAGSGAFLCLALLGG
jgi:hypothetical protein